MTNVCSRKEILDVKGIEVYLIHCRKLLLNGTEKTSVLSSDLPFSSSVLMIQ
jgi:hypothetical protein